MQLQKLISAEASGSLRGSGALRNWLSCSRPFSYWDVVGAHLLPAVIAGFPLMLSFLVPLKYVPMIPCTFLQFAGYPCPFCGFTRSFWAISNGDWAFAVYNYPLAGALYVLIVLVFAWNMAGLVLGKILIRGRALRLNPGRMKLLVVSAILILILNWAYRLSAGLK